MKFSHLHQKEELMNNVFPIKTKPFWFDIHITLF